MVESGPAWPFSVRTDPIARGSCSCGPTAIPG